MKHKHKPKLKKIPDLRDWHFFSIFATHSHFMGMYSQFKKKVPLVNQNDFETSFFSQDDKVVQNRQQMLTELGSSWVSKSESSFAIGEI